MTARSIPIGEVARSTGVTAATIRSWANLGLLCPTKTSSGKRLFSPDDLARIVAIDQLRKIRGFGLAAIRQTLNDSAATPSNGSADPSSRAPVSELAHRLRAMRLERRLSVRDVASRAGLAASFVSMLERGAASPSPATLARLAPALGVGLADLLGHVPVTAMGRVAAGAGRQVALGPKVGVEQVTVGRDLMDVELWTLAAGAESEGAYVHDGQEFVHVLEGTCEFGLDDQPMQPARQGDSLYFDSTRPHRWRNDGPAPAKLLWVNTDAARLAKPKLRTSAATPEDRLRALFPELAESPGRIVRVVDTHTAGHPTRVILDGIGALTGTTVRDQRDDFRARFDHLRGTLLHEPRGHAASFGVLLVPSSTADFGGFFIGSYRYLDMCGHGTIGLTRTLQALGQLEDRDGFTLETPAGIVAVALGGVAGRDVTLRNVPSRVIAMDVAVTTEHGLVEIDIAYGGVTYAIADATKLGLAIEPAVVGRFMALGVTIREALARHGHLVESVLFHEDCDRGHARHLVILEANKFDRSPCGTGTSARLAQLHARGRLALDEPYNAESVTGDRFAARIVERTDAGIVPEITGRAWLTAFSALVVEPGDPLQAGFLCG